MIKINTGQQGSSKECYQCWFWFVYVHGTRLYSYVDCSHVLHGTTIPFCFTCACSLYTWEQESGTSVNEAETVSVVLVNTSSYCWFPVFAVCSPATWNYCWWSIFVVCNLNVYNYCWWSIFVVCNLNVCNYCWWSIFVVRNLNIRNYCWWSIFLFFSGFFCLFVFSPENMHSSCTCQSLLYVILTHAHYC